MPGGSEILVMNHEPYGAQWLFDSNGCALPSPFPEPAQYVLNAPWQSTQHVLFTGGSQLRSLTHDGEIRWERSLRFAHNLSNSFCICYDDDIVLAMEKPAYRKSTGTITCLSASNGRTRWKLKAGLGSALLTASAVIVKSPSDCDRPALEIRSRESGEILKTLDFSPAMSDLKFINLWSSRASSLDMTALCSYPSETRHVHLLSSHADF